MRRATPCSRPSPECSTRNVRASDTVARIGGDEFGLILWNLGEGDAGSKAWALEAAITEAAIDWQGEPLAVGASIGFAMIGAEDELAAVMARADQAMYARKAAAEGQQATAQRVIASRNDVRRELVFAYLIRSRRCSLRFFSRWTCSRSEPGET